MKCAEININQNVWPFINKKKSFPSVTKYSQYISISVPSDHC